MTPFEYLSVLLSIILGLAITQILQGYRGLLLARSRVQRHWPSLLWSVMLLLFAAQAWWVSFGLEDKAEWRFDTFLVILLQMGLIYMLAALILPDAPEGAAIDLAGHFETQRRPFFACLLLIVAVSLLKDLMLEGRLPEALNVAYHAVLAGIAGIGLIVRRAGFHLALALFTAATFVLYVAMLFARL